MIRKLISKINGTRKALEKERAINHDEIRRLEESLARQESLLSRAKDVRAKLDSAPLVRARLEAERVKLKERREIVLQKIARAYLMNRDYRTPTNDLLLFTLLEFNLEDIAVAIEKEVLEGPKATLAELEKQIEAMPEPQSKNL